MRKVTRKAFRENANIFKRDAKRFELGMFDIEKKESVYNVLIINGCRYMAFSNELYNQSNKTFKTSPR